MDSSSQPSTISANPQPWMIGCMRIAGTAVDHPIARRDIEADAAFATTVFGAAGIGRGDMVLLTSGSSEYGQFWPYEVALESLGACIAIAENLPFDAARSEMFLRRLPVAAAFGLGMPVLQGMRALQVPLEKAFANTRVVFARDGVADELRAVGIAAWRLVDLGPAFLFESPDGVTRFDRSEWQIDSEDGLLVLSALKARANPLKRLRTEVRGSVAGAGHTVRLSP